MSSCSNIRKLKALSEDILNAAFKEIRSFREKYSPSDTGRYLIAEYLLQEAMEYVTGAWEMVESEKSNASIALSRWLLEASLNLIWTVANSDEIDERLKILCGEALRNETCLLEGLAELFPDNSLLFKENSAKVKNARDNLGVEKPDDLCTRLESIKKQSEMSKMKDLYPLYRICCASAHPSLKVWERFCCREGSAIFKDTINKQSVACWMASASTLYLVASTCCLTGLGDPKQQKDWWETKVRPLLNYD